MSNLGMISGGAVALKQAIEYKKHLLNEGYSSVDFCLDRGHDIFLIACQDSKRIDYVEDEKRQNGGLNLHAFENFTERNIGELNSEYNIVRFISWIYTDAQFPSYRGFGIGKLLVSRAISKLKEKNSVLAPIFLCEQPECIGYYNQFGFEDFDQGKNSNQRYDKCLKQIKSSANKILTRDRFDRSKTDSFFVDEHQTSIKYTPQNL